MASDKFDELLEALGGGQICDGDPMQSPFQVGDDAVANRLVDLRFRHKEAIDFAEDMRQASAISATVVFE